MQTTVDPPVALAPALRNSQVAEFLDTLRREQERYLDAIGCARALLPDHGLQVAQMSAVQGRLVRRLFDAQRAILEQRARVDDEFRSFLTTEIDGSRYERQLDALLDEWWQVERRATAVALETTVDQLLAEQHPGHVPAEPEPVPALVATGLLPLSLVDALDGAGSADLDRLLDELVADLDAHLAVAAASVAPAPARAPGDLVIVGTADDDAARFDSFWSQPGTELELADHGGALQPIVVADEEHSLSWIPTQVVVPIVAVTAGLSIALLLIG